MKVAGATFKVAGANPRTPPLNDCPDSALRMNLRKRVNADALAHAFLICSVINRPFPSSPGPLHQNEVRCSTFDMEMIFHSHANKTHFHKKS